MQLMRAKAMATMANETISRRLREKLSNAGPAKGRTSSAENAKLPDTTPTMDVEAPSILAYTGNVAWAANAETLWKKLAPINATKGNDHMLVLLAILACSCSRGATARLFTTSAFANPIIISANSLACRWSIPLYVASCSRIILINRGFGWAIIVSAQ